MKKFLCITVLLLLGTSVMAGSYIDKQLKETKKNQKYNTVKTQLEDTSFVDSYIQKSNIKDIKDPKLIKLSNIEPVDEKLYQKKIAQDEKIYEDQIEGRNAVIKLLESNKNVNKLYVTKNTLGIGALDGIIYLDIIKPIGKSEMDIKSYLNGKYELLIK